MSNINKYKKTVKTPSNLYLPKAMVDFMRREDLNASQIVTDLLSKFLAEHYGPKYRLKHDRKRLDVLRMFIFKNADSDGNFKIELKPYKTISRKIEHVEF